MYSGINFNGEMKLRRTLLLTQNSSVTPAILQSLTNGQLSQTTESLSVNEFRIVS